MKNFVLSLLIITGLSFQVSAEKTVLQEDLFETTEKLKPLNIFKAQKVTLFELVWGVDECEAECAEIRTICYATQAPSDCNYEYGLCIGECTNPDGSGGGGSGDGEDTEDDPG